MKKEITSYTTALVNIYTRIADRYKDVEDIKFLNILTDLLTFTEDLQEDIYYNQDTEIPSTDKDKRIEELELAIRQFKKFNDDIEAKYENCRNIASGRIGGYKNTITQNQLKIAALESEVTKWRSDSKYKTDRITALAKELIEYQDRCKRANI